MPSVIVPQGGSPIRPGIVLAAPGAGLASYALGERYDSLRRTSTGGLWVEGREYNAYGEGTRFVASDSAFLINVVPVAQA